MCVVQPSHVGFNLGDVEIIKNLPTEVRAMLSEAVWKSALLSSVLFPDLFPIVHLPLNEGLIKFCF
jgi:hypothetical protein